MSDTKRETLGDSGKEHCNHCAGEALVDPAVNDELESMRKDAARYEWLRLHWGHLATITNWPGNSQQRFVTHIGRDLSNMVDIDPQSLDQAIDSALEREQQGETHVNP